ncbi:MAG: carboxypeptidase-like regulatory domain-containing protein [Myxococcaceae bacterium]
MRVSRSVLLVPFLLCACGPKDENHDGIADGVKDPNSISLVAPSTPIGTLSGQVLNTRLEPLAEAKVNLSVGGRAADLTALSTTSDAAGYFSFQGLPGGAQVQATITKEGYATVRTTATIPSTAGNFPINDGNAAIGPFALTKLDGTLKFNVITRTGKPAKGVKATLEATPAATQLSTFSTYGSNLGVVVVDATADDVGQLSFSGVPSPDELSRLGGNYNLTVQGYDEANDGYAEFLGWYQVFSGQSMVTNPSTRVITLPDARSGQALSVVASNVDSIMNPGSAPPKNMVRPGESLYFVFNEPVLETSLTVRLTDELGQQSIVISKALRIGTALTISPTTPLEVGKEYNVSIRATSLDNGTTFSRAAYFFCADPSAPKTFAVSKIQFRDTLPPPPTGPNSALNQGETVVLTFNQPIFLIGSAPAEAFIDADFDGDGKREMLGEKGAANGFPMIASEPTSEKDTLFTLVQSGYTTRFTFVFSGGTLSVANNTQVSVPFGKLLNATGGYQTIWGTPVTSEESSGATAIPP